MGLVDVHRPNTIRSLVQILSYSSCSCFWRGLYAHLEDWIGRGKSKVKPVALDYSSATGLPSYNFRPIDPYRLRVSIAPIHLWTARCECLKECGNIEEVPPVVIIHICIRVIHREELQEYGHIEEVERAIVVEINRA